MLLRGSTVSERVNTDGTVGTSSACKNIALADRTHVTAVPHPTKKESPDASEDKVALVQSDIDSQASSFIA